MFKSKKSFSEIVAPMGKPKKANPFAKSAAPVMDDEGAEPADTAVRMVVGAKNKKATGKKPNPFAKGGGLISKGMGGMKFGKC